MLLKTTTTPPPSSLCCSSTLLKKPAYFSKLPLLNPFNSSCTPTLNLSTLRIPWLINKFNIKARPLDPTSISTVANGPDTDLPGQGYEFAQLGAGCFWGVELAYQRVPGVVKTEVGYSQGFLDEPSYGDVCSGSTEHSEVVRVCFDPKECGFDDLLSVFWTRHDPTMLNRQGNDVGTQYRSGIYFYGSEQEKVALESKDRQQKLLKRQIVTEILPARKFYRAEELHQQYLAKGGRFGSGQSAEKGCNDPIRCYG